MDSSLATSGEQNSGEAYLTRSFRFGLYLRAKPKSMILSSSEDELERRRFSGYKVENIYNKSLKQTCTTAHIYYIIYVSEPMMTKGLVKIMKKKKKKAMKC